jgi:hypothetical protein
MITPPVVKSFAGAAFRGFQRDRAGRLVRLGPVPREVAAVFPPGRVDAERIAAGGH